MGLTGLVMASYGGLKGILTRLTKSTDHTSIIWIPIQIKM